MSFFKKLSSFAKKNQLLVGLVVLGLLLVVADSYGYKMVENMTGSQDCSGKKTVKYFHMDGCPHCNDFEPTWSEFQNSDTGDVCKQKVERGQMSESDQSLGVQGFPTVVLLDENGNKAGELQDRTLEGLQNLANQ